jgi:hypothetical protein
LGSLAGIVFSKNREKTSTKPMLWKRKVNLYSQKVCGIFGPLALWGKRKQVGNNGFKRVASQYNIGLMGGDAHIDITSKSARNPTSNWSNETAFAKPTLVCEFRISVYNNIQ